MKVPTFSDTIKKEGLPPSEKKYLGKYKPKKNDDYLSLEYAAKHPTLISLFSGAGGAALGVQAAGFEVRVMVEWDKAACNTLRSNWTRAGHIANCDAMIASLKAHPNNKNGYGQARTDGLFFKEVKGNKQRWHGPDDPVARQKMIESFEKQKTMKKWAAWAQKREPAILQADITKLKTADILEAAGLRVGEATMLEGGFPCQGFSLANSARKNHDYSTDARNFLYLECVRVIREALPRTFMLENVPGLVSMEKGRIIRMICNDLANSGYNIMWDIHNAADYGVPQNRKRVIIVGFRNDVLFMPASGKPQLHIGGAAGIIQHPAWLDKKYPLDKPLEQPSLFDALSKKV